MRTTAMRKNPTMPPGLPGTLPDGTRYVVEGRRGKGGGLEIVSRQVILPTGEQVDVAGPAKKPRKLALAVRRKGATIQRRS